MKISIRVKPGVKINKIERRKDSDNSFTAWVKAPAKAGQANETLVEVLADYFKVSQSSIKIVRGRFSRQKIISIPDWLDLCVGPEAK